MAASGSSAVRIRNNVNDLQFHTNGSQRATITSGGAVCVGVTSDAGSVSNTAIVAGGIFKTLSGNLSVNHNTATTMFTVPTSTAAYLVTVNVDGDRADLYAATYLINTQGGSSTVATQLYKGTNMTVSMSGYAVQVTQTSGATNTVYYSMIRIY
jgi:hypothetical protein